MTFITCPSDPKKTLGIKLPFLVMIIKNLKKYFTFEVQVSSSSFRFSHFAVIKKNLLYFIRKINKFSMLSYCWFLFVARHEKFVAKNEKEIKTIRVSGAIALIWLIMPFCFCFVIWFKVLDDKNVRRRFRASNYQSTTRVKPFICTMPMRLDVSNDFLMELEWAIGVHFDNWNCCILIYLID